MKKHVLLSLFTLYNLNACNLVPVAKLSNQENRTDIYNAIYSNSMPVLQGRSDELTPAEISNVCADPSIFLAAKIMAQDSEAKIAFLPKSLYQLFVFAEAIHNWKETTDSINKLEDIAEVFNTEPEINCAAYMAKPSVQNFFWKLNDFMVEFLGDTFEVARYNKEQLSNITHELCKDIVEVMRSANHFPNKFYAFCACTTCYSTQMQLVFQERLSIDDLIWKEYESRDNYLIYRGVCHDDLRSLKSLDFSLSFSDGLFGGIMLDAETGMAFNYWEPGRTLLSIHIPAEDLLYQKNGAQIFNIPIITPLGAAWGLGEFHHVRTKALKSKGNNAFKNCRSHSKVDPSLYPELWLDSNDALEEFKRNYYFKEETVATINPHCKGYGTLRDYYKGTPPVAIPKKPRPLFSYGESFIVPCFFDNENLSDDYGFFYTQN